MRIPTWMVIIMLVSGIIGTITTATELNHRFGKK